MKDKEFKYEIINKIGVISTSSSGWNTELNRISWNGKKPKYDLRAWAPDHSKMGKGITLSEKDLEPLVELLLQEIRFLQNERFS